METREQHDIVVCMSKSEFVDLKNDWNNAGLENLNNILGAVSTVGVFVPVPIPILGQAIAVASAYIYVLEVAGSRKQDFAADMQTTIDGMNNDEYVIMIKRVESVYSTMADYQNQTPTTCNVLDISYSVETRGFTGEQLEAYVG